MFKRKTTFFTKLIKEDEEKRFLNESNDYKKQFKKQKNRDHKIGADIYSIAIVALLNPHEIDVTDEQEKKGFYKPIKITRQAKNNIFLNALLVASIQTIVMYLITITDNFGDIYLSQN